MKKEVKREQESVTWLNEKGAQTLRSVAPFISKAIQLLSLAHVFGYFGFCLGSRRFLKFLGVLYRAVSENFTLWGLYMAALDKFLHQSTILWRLLAAFFFCSELMSFSWFRRLNYIQLCVTYC